jgi:hypothetical protein
MTGAPSSESTRMYFEKENGAKGEEGLRLNIIVMTSNFVQNLILIFDQFSFNISTSLYSEIFLEMRTIGKNQERKDHKIDSVPSY